MAVKISRSRLLSSVTFFWSIFCRGLHDAGSREVVHGLPDERGGLRDDLLQIRWQMHLNTRFGFCDGRHEIFPNEASFVNHVTFSLTDRLFAGQAGSSACTDAISGHAFRNQIPRSVQSFSAPRHDTHCRRATSRHGRRRVLDAADALKVAEMILRNRLVPADDLVKNRARADSHCQPAIPPQRFRAADRRANRRFPAVASRRTWPARRMQPVGALQDRSTAPLHAQKIAAAPVLRGDVAEAVERSARRYAENPRATTAMRL